MESFDLFKLYTKEDTIPRLWICAVGRNLHKKLGEIMDEIIKHKGHIVFSIKIKKEIIQKTYNKAIEKAKSQQILAKILKIPRQNLYKWKECKRRIPLSILDKLIKYSGTNFNVQEITLETRKHVSGFNRQKIAKIIAKGLNIRLSFAERVIYQKRKEVALIFILKLLTLWKNLLNKSDRDLEKKKIEIQKTFEFLKQNTNKARSVKAVPALTPTFAKVTGAILADGCIVKSDNSLRILDEDKKNIEKFSRWMKRLFGIPSVIRKSKGTEAWNIKIDNKVIQRYFTEVFKFNKGKKKENYSIPNIIKNSDFEIRKACVLGVMAFDGIVRTNKEIGLNIGSKKLRDDVFKILVEEGINLNKSNKPDSTGMWKLYSSGKFDKEQYKKWRTYFIKDSNKWFKINEFINGFSKKITSIDEAFIILKKCFKPQSASKIDLASIFKIFVSDDSLTTKQILFYLNRRSIKISEETLWLYLNILREMNIIRKERNGNTNLYFFNADLNKWHLPYRPE